jgi:signal-transduction protein with cAMP-binding, CBS, and nucleotidyltransferase domain
MPRAEDLLRTKNDRSVVWIAPDSSALDASRRMSDRHVGSLAVIGAGGELVGILTERDILNRVVAQSRDPSSTSVADIMTRDVICCDRETRCCEIKALMRDQRIRHVPVVESKRVVGMISIGDLNAAEAEEMVMTIQYLEQYVTPA